MASNRVIRAAVPESVLKAIGTRAPAGAEVMALDADTELETIDFLVPAHGATYVLDVLPALTRLVVLQTLSAGTERFEPLMPAQATLCSARGARDGPVAEWIVGALLGASSGLLEFARRREWASDRPVEDLASFTVVIVGMGSIGHRVEELLAPFGTRVVGVASRARDHLHGIDELGALLPDADAVVLLAPLSESTRGLIAAAELAAMRDGTVVINAARGPVLDADALLAEVVTGRLRAVLDVTDPEPLPAQHPLWDAPGVLCVTPHFAGNSPLADARAAGLARDQLGRFCAGDPLLNVVIAGS